MAARERPERSAAPPGRPAPLPAGFEAQLATLTSPAPAGDDWLHEIKLDGYRIGCRIERGRVRLLGRRGSEWTDKFPEIRQAAERLPVTAAFLDGEVAVVDGKGQTHFHLLQEALAGGARAGLVYFVFDLLHHDGRDLRPLPLEDRKRALEALLKPLPGEAPLRAVGHIVGNGPAVFDQACRLGLEGIVSKRRDQAYRPGRGPGWLKIKCALRQELVVGGFTLPKGTRNGLGALYCGHMEGGRLRFAGKVGTGFTERVAVALRRQLDALTQSPCPFDPLPDPEFRRDAVWVRPALVVEVRFANWTGDGRLRHASFEGLRPDKRPADVRRERPDAT
jgi:bifunctional non-homologous end joining protein LigD